MSTTNIWKLSAIVTPAGQINQLTTRSINPGIERAIIRGDGRVNPIFAARIGQRPMLSFVTTDVAAALGTLSSGFYGFSSATTFYLTKLADGGGVAAGSAHATIALAKGCIVPRTLECAQGQLATLSCDVYGVSADGTTIPISYTASQALPTLTVSPCGYTLGPVKINGNALGGVQRWRLDFGYREQIIASDGQLFPTFGCYDEHAPLLTIGLQDPTILASGGATGLIGAAQGSTATVIYLRKLADEGGGLVADATAEHCKLTITAKGYFQPEQMSESDDSPSELDIAAVPLYDGSNAILAISTTSSIA